MESLIEAAELLIQELREPHPRAVIAAIAIHQREQSAAVLENLIALIRGYVAGSRADQERLTSAASALLSEITKLRAALHTRERLGLTENEQERFTRDWLTGSAPRLFELAERLREILDR